jgi:hypothetical protein
MPVKNYGKVPIQKLKSRCTTKNKIISHDYLQNTAQCDFLKHDRVSRLQRLRCVVYKLTAQYAMDE